MKALPSPNRVFVYGKPVDMRKSFDGLFELVGRNLEENPLSGDLFIFVNRRSNYLKGLLWDRTGFLLVAKRLESGQFKLRNKAEKVIIQVEDLRRLLDGLPVGGVQISGSKSLNSGPLSPSQSNDPRGSSNFAAGASG